MNVAIITIISTQVLKMGSEKLLPFHYDHSFGSEKSSQHEATSAVFGFPGGLSKEDGRCMHD